MRTYTVVVQWLRWTKRDYKRCNVTVRGIKADSATDACAAALKPYEGHTNASISSIWYDWPQTH